MVPELHRRSLWRTLFEAGRMVGCDRCLWCVLSEYYRIFPEHRQDAFRNAGTASYLFTAHFDQAYRSATRPAMAIFGQFETAMFFMCQCRITDHSFAAVDESIHEHETGGGYRFRVHRPHAGWFSQLHHIQPQGGNALFHICFF